MRFVLSLLAVLTVSVVAVGDEPAGVPNAISNRQAAPKLAAALAALDARQDDLIFDNWHGAGIDLAELRQRLGLRDWDAAFDRERLLSGLEAIYAKAAGNAEMRSVLSQFEVREALKQDLSAIAEPLAENDVDRERIARLAKRLHNDLLVQMNDEKHAIRLTGLGLLQRLRVEDRATGKVLFEEWARFDTRQVGGKSELVLPKNVDELPPKLRAKILKMVSDPRLAPYLSNGC